MTTQQWSVWSVHYDAPRADQRLKAGERTMFQASSWGEVLEKAAIRGIDVHEHNVEIFRERFEQTSAVEAVDPYTGAP